MQSGALATDGLDYDEVFGDDEPEDSSGWGDRFPRQSRADERTAYDWGGYYDDRQYGDYGYSAGALQSGAHKPQTGRKRTTTGRTIPGIDGARPSQADSGFRGLAAGTG